MQANHVTKTVASIATVMVQDRAVLYDHIHYGHQGAAVAVKHSAVKGTGSFLFSQLSYPMMWASLQLRYCRMNSLWT